MQQRACYRHPNEPTGIACQRCQRPICHRCMVGGAVGFQCPSCIEAGRRETWQGRLVYGGRPSKNPMQTSVAIMAINAVIWFAVLLTGMSSSPIVDWLGLRVEGLCAISDQSAIAVPQANCPGVWYPGFSSGAYWQALTSAFLHVDMLHIAFNMAALFILGPQLERALGRARFLTLYLLSALAGSVFVVWLTPGYVTTLGASGAIFGMMGAVLALVLKHRGDVRTILIWLGANVVITLVGAGSISWQGHLGGLVGGLLVTAALIMLPREQRDRWQWPLVGVVAALIVAGLAIPVLI